MRYRHIVYYILLSVFSFLIASCTIEGSKNGEFDGAWHLVRVNDEPPAKSTIYWNVQGKLLQVIDRDNNEDLCYYFRFERSSNQLQLRTPYVTSELEDVPLEDLTELVPFGIDDVSEPFVIEHLDGSRMTLKSSTKKLDFRQF